MSVRNEFSFLRWSNHPFVGSFIYHLMCKHWLKTYCMLCVALGAGWNSVISTPQGSCLRKPQSIVDGSQRGMEIINLKATDKRATGDACGEVKVGY